ncbi:IPT/TIG domain-containing protein [Gloeobacter kilaueensis]|uniref:Cell surface receptor IPT/TIG domain-containing protein n=1 Tax=Gloeobacter kilaueensis (strain ATCC BAA-2537 / CCAP 1431/1 / ULC 316 / JS1) TaxID=1183438 RepID=U5QCH1_GLOK1|nr:IPT/TIG domain-containing protein [Gloeobacter kilaueensis]AGY56533.1 cell surface receptor IPT/TIG domain-containing protein [Gloeobacter kilaueensis JS1]
MSVLHRVSVCAAALLALNATAASIQTFSFNLPPSSALAQTAATISSFSPTNGSTGTQVAIKGSGFYNGVSSVKFGNGYATYTVDSDSQITATVPSSATTGNIVANIGGSYISSSSGFTVSANISSFSPTSGLPGTQVVIKGAGFYSGTNSVKFGNGYATYTVNSDSQITATVPSNATTGNIVVKTSIAQASSSTPFTFITPTPSITSVSPTSGPPGTQLIVTGSNLNGASSVKVGNTYLTYAINSTNQITATTPTGNFSGPVTVKTSTGTATSSSSFSSAPASISSFSPTNGTIYTQVVIKGTNLINVTSVAFQGADGNPAYGEYTWDSSSQVTATVPTTARSGPITLSMGDSQVSTSQNFTLPDAGVPADVPSGSAYVDSPTSAPSGWTSATYWGQSIVDTNQPSSPGSVEIDYMELWCVVSGKNTLMQHDEGTMAGGLYVRDPWYGNNDAHDPMPWSYNAANNSTTFTPTTAADKVWHFYGTAYPRPSFAANTVSSCSVKGRLKITGPVLVQIGADYWINPTAPHAGLDVNNHQMGVSNWYFASPDWQDVSFP